MSSRHYCINNDVFGFMCDHIHTSIPPTIRSPDLVLRMGFWTGMPQPGGQYSSASSGHWAVPVVKGVLHVLRNHSKMTIQSLCSMRYCPLANVPSHNWLGEKQNSSDPVLGHAPSPRAHFGSKKQLDITLRFAATDISHKHYNFMHKRVYIFNINIHVCLE